MAAAAALQVVAALVARRVKVVGRTRTVVGVVVLAAVAFLVIAGGLAYAARNGGASAVTHKLAHQFSSSDSGGITVSSGAGRLLTLGNNGRIPMAREGLHSFTRHPVAGTGAGTFQFINDLYRTNASIVVKHAHDQWVNVLSETGAVGFILFVLAVGGLLVAALRPLGRAGRDLDRGLLAAMQAAGVAFVAHVTIDWDWDMAAAALAFLLLVGVAGAYLRGRRESLAEAATDGEAPVVRRRALDLRFGVASRVLVSGVLVLVAVSFLAPYLSNRALSRALVLASDGRTTAAVTQARRAHRLDPLAVDPLFALAQVEQQQGREAASLATLRQAVRLQPQNFTTYYQLGQLQLDVLGQRDEAVASLRRALALNPDDADARDELQSALATSAAP